MIAHSNASEADRGLRASARCVQSALELFDDSDVGIGEDGLASTSALDAVLSAAQQHLEGWITWALNNDTDGGDAYDTLDGIIVVRALLAAGMRLRNSVTIDPRAGILRMVADRLAQLCEQSDEAFIEGAPESEQAQTAFAHAAPARQQ